MTQRGDLMRVDMMAVVLRRHAGLTIREIIALVDKEFRWKTNESAVTAKVYTRRDKFVHIQPDRSANRRSPNFEVDRHTGRPTARSQTHQSLPRARR